MTVTGVARHPEWCGGRAPRGHRAHVLAYADNRSIRWDLGARTPNVISTRHGGAAGVTTAWRRCGGSFPSPP